MIIVISIFVVLIVLLIVALVHFYNTMISLEFSLDRAFEDLSTHLQKRLNIASSLQDIMQSSSLKKIIRGWNKAKEQDTIIEYDKQFTLYIQELLEDTEVDKKQINNILKELVEIEEDIASMRRFYASTVTEYNIMLEKFPTNLLAQTLSKKKRANMQLVGDEKLGVDANFKVA